MLLQIELVTSYVTISQIVSSGSASRFLLCAASVSGPNAPLFAPHAQLSALHAPVPAAVRLGARHLHGSGAVERWSGGVTEQQDHRAIE